MRRHTWFRAVATLLALWFPLIAGEPGLLHPCPMHGAGAAVAASLLRHSAGVGTAHSAHSAHAAHSAHHDGAPSHDHHDCTCINGCCVSMAAMSAPLPATIEVAEAEIVSRPAVSSAPSLARPAPEFSRPWTTGPPRA